MRWLWILLLAVGLTACGIDGAPVPPDSDQDPNIAEDPADIDVDPFFD